MGWKMRDLHHHARSRWPRDTAARAAGVGDGARPVKRPGPARRPRAAPQSPWMRQWPRLLWWLVLFLGLLPALWLAARGRGAFGGLGVNPIETLLTQTGTFTIIALLATLSVTPLRRLTGLAPLLRLRRMLGLLAFAYATTHFLIWLGVDLFFDWSLVLEDLGTRPFVMAGFSAWVILLLLAATSTRSAMTLLKRNWTRLHRLVYLAGILGVVHVVWLTRADYRDATIYALVLAGLLGMRVVWALRGRRKVRGEPARNGAG